ncbi:centrosomal protein of 170 kDa isoform X12 [Octodon degus]|uniref:Centrosomal protein of 170 kDa n=1 Tax=Octodon degus TaxID=10160 RepID=A0A6P6E146_OCTDE|nr:centrosomal protein of 170 kDa isoform X12 [Octodon degus]
MSLTSWFLVSSGGTRHRLPREMIFVGRDDCELMLQSRSVDKQHAVINYDASTDEHLVKDLGSLNGTFVNDVRIPEQTYITLKLEDKLRFGYDTNLFTVVRGEMRVPEEALKHEKFTIQLQLSQKSSESELSKSASAKSVDSKVADAATEVQHKPTETLKSEEKAVDVSAMPRGTPLYGQPSWWGDDDEEEQRAFKSNGKPEEKSHETGTSGNKHDDGTQSDSENTGAHRRCSKRATLEEHLRRHHSEQKKLQKSQASEKHQDPAVTSSAHHRGGGHGVPHGKLLKQKSEEPSVSIPFLQTALLRSSGSLGHRPSQEMDKILKNQATSATSEKDNDDDQSDKGTYTIELENPNSEEVEARKMIDKVFGVDDNQDYNRPVINEKHKDLIKDWALSSAAIIMEERKPLSTSGFHNSEAGTSSSGSKRWVSQWASLAANHTRHDQEERMELSAPIPLESETGISESGISLRGTGSAASLASQGERRRRTLPQLPNEEKSLESSRVKVVTQRSEIGEKQDTELQEKETPVQVHQKDKQDADRALSKMNRAVNGETLKTSGDNKTLLHLGSSSPGKEKNEPEKEASLVKQTLAKIQQQQEQKEQAQWTPTKLSSKNISGQVDKCREDSSKQESPIPEKIPGHSTSKGERLIQNESKRRKAEETVKSQITKGADKKESSKSLVRQGSFTIEKPTPNIPIELIPHINKQTSSTPPVALAPASRLRERSDSLETDSSMDTTLILKDTEAVMAFLEAKLREDKTDEGPDTPSYNRDNSISPESDVDTASTISLVTGETERKSTQKRKSFTSLYKDRCSTGSPSKDVTKSSSGAREKVEKKTKSRSTDVGSRADGRKFVQSSGRIRQPSVDLTDDDQTSSVPHSAISDILSSDQETYSCKSHGRTPLNSTDEHVHSKLEGGKGTKSKTSPAASSSSSKSTTLPRPRPTRTSLLRRARLGEASDSELADADKASVASEVSTTSSTSKPPTGRRNISRIDLLAQPRRTRLGSLSARSDSEATISRSSASSRTAEAIIRSGARLVPSDKFSPRIRANSISRLSDSKVKSMSSAHGSPSVNSRWRRFPTDYASTSEDEFGSNRNSPKHTRLRTSPALKTTRLQSCGSAMPTSSSSFKHRIKEQEDYIRDWTAHREEIARISQDLALIAREINDVAGEIDSVTSSGTAPSTTVSTAATTPGSAIDTREEVGDLHGEMHKLVDRVFDESLNFRKIPPLVHCKTPEGNNGRSGDPRPPGAEPPDHLTITRRRTWSRDEVMGDNLLLSSVFQFSRKIRQSIDKTAGKIRILFKDKDRNWDEIESKLRTESEVPIVKTSSMEISSILQELKRVEKQLQAINAMIDPDGTLEALNNMGFPSAVLPSPPKQKSSPVNNHSSPGQTPTLCQPEARVLHPAAVSVSAEFENAESEADFSIHFNRFNPDGEEEDITVHE